jgi:hypothetical protein
MPQEDRSAHLCLVRLPAFIYHLTVAKPLNTKLESTMRISLATVLSMALMAGAAQAEQCNITVLFPFNSSTIPAEFLPVLDQSAAALKSGKIEIFGHTDLVGSAEYNLKLSQRRAQAVEDRLLAAGVSPANIVKVEGLGKADPVVQTTAANQENRRVLVQIDDCREEVFAAAGLSTGQMVALGVLGAAAVIALASGSDGDGGSSTTTTTTTTTAP